ncbi:MAG: hypothetical protein J6X39_00225 [Bacteroidales bacterium]|nr:hypothetical protein [Bacteroidales bacterium]
MKKVLPLFFYADNGNITSIGGVGTLIYGGGAGVSPYGVTGLIKSGAGGWTPYQIGRDYLGSITDISDLSGQLFIYRKGGIGEGVPTGLFIFKK